jgi:hypothetical protein
VSVSHSRCNFVHDNETKAVVYDPAGDVAANNKSAAEGCPFGAIELSGYEGA